jgi:hypothetical protein
VGLAAEADHSVAAAACFHLDPCTVIHWLKG